MRRSREDTAETRRAIVEAASRLFRVRGIAAVAIADVMGALGMTAGGFYRHFETKEALVAEAIGTASTAAQARLAPVAPRATIRVRGAAIVGRYLSRPHVDDAEHGCPVAALCAEIAHEGATTREAFTGALRGLLEVAKQVIPGATQRAHDERLHAAAAMVGAVVLARASADRVLADEMLAAVRRGIMRNRGRAGGSRARRSRRPPSAPRREADDGDGPEGPSRPREPNLCGPPPGGVHAAVRVGRSGLERAPIRPPRYKTAPSHARSPDPARDSFLSRQAR